MSLKRADYDTQASGRSQYLAQSGYPARRSLSPSPTFRIRRISSRRRAASSNSRSRACFSIRFSSFCAFLRSCSGDRDS